MPGIFHTLTWCAVLLYCNWPTQPQKGICLDECRPHETASLLFIDLWRNPERTPHLIMVSTESNLSKTDDRPQSRQRHDQKNQPTTAPTSKSLHHTFIRFSTFHHHSPATTREKSLLIAAVSAIYSSRMHCGVHSVVGANKSFKYLKTCGPLYGHIWLAEEGEGDVGSSNSRNLGQRPCLCMSIRR